MMRFAVSLLATTLLQAADVSGTWVGQMPVRKDQLQDVAIKLVQSGTSVTGKVYGDYASSPVVEGRTSGDEVSFLVIIAEQAGNQINETRHRFTGTVKDGQLELIRTREGATNAGNGGEVQFKGESKISFHLKRLY